MRIWVCRKWIYFMWTKDYSHSTCTRTYIHQFAKFKAVTIQPFFIWNIIQTLRSFVRFHRLFTVYKQCIYFSNESNNKKRSTEFKKIMKCKWFIATQMQKEQKCKKEKDSLIFRSDFEPKMKIAMDQCKANRKKCRQNENLPKINRFRLEALECAI